MVTRRPVSVSVRCGRYSTDPNATVCRDLTASRVRCGGTFRVSVRADPYALRRPRPCRTCRSTSASLPLEARAVLRSRLAWGRLALAVDLAVDGADPLAAGPHDRDLRAPRRLPHRRYCWSLPRLAPNSSTSA